MQSSREVRRKLAVVIGNLMSRCIDDAGKIPYILSQDETVDILVRNPQLFEKLVLDEHSDCTEYSKGQLTARIDALGELAQFNGLDSLQVSLSNPDGPEMNLSPLVERVYELTRTFSVYLANTVALFERELEGFVEKLRQSLQRAGTPSATVELDGDDIEELERIAETYFTAGQFLQAFLFERLLAAHLTAKQVISFMSEGHSINERLIHNGLRSNSVSFALLAKFILRVSYISQGSWQDLFETLVRLGTREPDMYNRSILVDLIEQDPFFCCNLLGTSFADLRRWTPSDRRSAIQTRLKAIDPSAAKGRDSQSKNA